MMMHMTLYWGNQVTLLFDSWTTDSWPSYALALLICLLFAVFYQFLESLRLHLKSPVNPSPPSLVAPLISRKIRRNWRVRLGSAALFGVNSAIGYLIMLAIMSYNGGVLLAVVIGLIVGHYVFRSGEFAAGDGGDDYSVGAETNVCGCS
ncbi:hypothetical protein ACP275_10G063400 [Erythranthe tilingii]